MKSAIDRNWWKGAADEAETDIRTKRAIDRSFIRRVKVPTPKPRRERPASPISMEIHYPISHWAEIIHFTSDTIRAWCRMDEIEARWIKGEYRISERAMNAFVESQGKSHGK